MRNHGLSGFVPPKCCRGGKALTAKREKEIRSVLLDFAFMNCFGFMEADTQKPARQKPVRLLCLSGRSSDLAAVHPVRPVCVQQGVVFVRDPLRHPLA